MIVKVGSLLLYYLIFAISIVFFALSERVSSKNVEKFLILMGVIIVSVFAGMRDFSVGTDTLNTVNKYNVTVLDWRELFQSAFSSSGFFLYYLLTKILSFFSLSHRAFLGAISFATVGPIAICAYKQKEKVPVWFTMTIYLLFYFQLSFNWIRQCLAVSILLLSIFLLLEKKIIKGLFCVVLACLFHNSAILGVMLCAIVYFSLRIKNVYYRYFALFLSAFLFVFVFSSWQSLALWAIQRGILPSSYRSYVTVFSGELYLEKELYRIGKKVYLDEVFKVLYILIPTFIHKKQKMETDFEFSFFRMCSILALVIYSVILFGLRTTYGARLSYLLEITIIIYFSRSVRFNKSLTSHYLISYNQLLLIGMALFYNIWTYLIKGIHATLPFSFNL